MRHFAIGIALSCLSVLAVAADPAEITKQMIGHEYVAAPPGPFPGFDGCMYEGGGMVGDTTDGFGAIIIRCSQSRLLVLDRTVSEGNGWLRNRILDAIVLPKYDRHGTSRDNKSKQLWPNGMCAFDGDYEKDMRVLLRWGGRERITSKNGVLAAWGFDLEKGKIIPLDISRIICEKPDEP